MEGNVVLSCMENVISCWCDWHVKGWGGWWAVGYNYHRILTKFDDVANTVRVPEAVVDDWQNHDSGEDG